MSTKTSFEVREPAKSVLSRADISEGSVQLPGEQLERKAYVAVMKVLKEFGGKWDRKTGTHKLPAGQAAKLLAALGSGIVVREKVVRQAYYTKPEAAREVCLAAGFDKSSRGRMLEPSCGKGALIDAALSMTTEIEVEAFDTDEEALLEVQQKFGSRVSMTNQDFLAVNPEVTGFYDFVLMNPPFRNQTARKHLLHAVTFLTEGGVLVAIMPETQIPEGFGVVGKLPGGSFEGTNVSASIVRYLKV